MTTRKPKHKQAKDTNPLANVPTERLELESAEIVVEFYKHRTDEFWKKTNKHLAERHEQLREELAKRPETKFSTYSFWICGLGEL